MEVTSFWDGGYRCRVTARDFEIRADEPDHVGGDDTGPTPTELLGISLASCFAMAVVHVARKQDIGLEDLTVRVTGESEGARISALRVEVSSSHPSGDLETLVEHARRYCFVSNTLDRPPEVVYTVAP